MLSYQTPLVLVFVFVFFVTLSFQFHDKSIALGFIVSPSSTSSSLIRNKYDVITRRSRPSETLPSIIFTTIPKTTSKSQSSNRRSTTTILKSSTTSTTTLPLDDYDIQLLEIKNKFTSLPRHNENDDINYILTRTEDAITKLYDNSIEETLCESSTDVDNCIDEINNDETVKEKVYANSYVNLGKVDTVGFDFDYTLVTYKDELLDLIYDMTLKRLVHDYQYPLELLDAKLKFDPSFSVRGLAVDRETGWICHLSYTHKVAVAYEGRKRVSRERLMKEYRGKRSLTPGERKKRLKPLNDLFSMAECCLIADVVQFFHDNNIPYCSKNAVVDILDAIGRTHISGDFHRMVRFFVFFFLDV